MQNYKFSILDYLRTGPRLLVAMMCKHDMQLATSKLYVLRFLEMINIFYIGEIGEGGSHVLIIESLVSYSQLINIINISFYWVVC